MRRRPERPAAAVARAAMLVVALSAAPGAHAADLGERLALHEGPGGTTCGFYLDGALAWERPGGDWLDAKGRRHGAQPFAVADSSPANGAVWDLTTLVQRALNDRRARAGLLLRLVGDGGPALFHSREGPPTERPLLALEWDDGQRDALAPSGDTQLDCSTVAALGRQSSLKVSERSSALLEFRLPAARAERKLKRARLLMAGTGVGGRAQVAVFESAPPAMPTGAPQPGLAAAYPQDQGIERDPQVVFVAQFEEGPAGAWRQRFAKDGFGELQVVQEDAVRGFVPLVGPALRINVKKGSHYGSDLRHYLKAGPGGEPDELYFRYYLRFARDWNPTLDGGKLPGLAGTYNRGGWGGRKADGHNGWSMRGAFAMAYPADHPLRGLTQLQTYAYHAEMATPYGDIWPWPGALLERDRWYCVEQHIKLNRPGAADGLVRAWIDGRPVFERRNVRFRHTDALRIETVWIDVYHGGSENSPHDQHLYVDNVVAARRYIGPMAAGATGAPTR